MLTLRTAQVEALAQTRRLDFEARLRGHLRRSLPEHTRALSDAELDETIREGVRRAKVHDIRTERGASIFIGLRFMLGRDFDRDPRLPWVREILDGTRVHRGLSTIELLLREAVQREAAARETDVRRAG